MKREKPKKKKRKNRKQNNVKMYLKLSDDFFVLPRNAKLKRKNLLVFATLNNGETSQNVLYDPKTKNVVKIF